MKDNLTVYFDTSFYVHLCRSDKDAAAGAIKSLNDGKVRHVLSEVIIRELLTSRDRTAEDKALVDRVSQLAIPPYRTRVDLDWQVLLLSGSQRVDVANIFRSLDDLLTLANSFSIMADRKTNEDQAIQLSKAGNPYLRPYGFPENFDENPDRAFRAATKMLEDMFEQFGFEGLDFPNCRRKALDLAEQIKTMLGPEQIKSWNLISN